MISPEKTMDPMNPTKTFSYAGMPVTDNKNDAPSFSAASLTLPQGLIGFPGFHEFGLLDLPDPRLAQFKLLQAINDPDLSFFLLPLDPENGPIDAEDLNKALAILEIEQNCASVLSIVTLRKNGDVFSATTNLRAPIFIDAEKKTGRQYVLPNDKYNIRHTLA